MTETEVISDLVKTALIAVGVIAYLVRSWLEQRNNHKPTAGEREMVKAIHELSDTTQRHVDTSRQFWEQTRDFQKRNDDVHVRMMDALVRLLERSEGRR